ncbi:MAG: LPS-assembly protein LptD [Bacteroidales bacterium]|nr:LPS-assembly protein LptD [Bacteroidales bacterium]
MYFFKEKRFLVVFLVMVHSLLMFSQEGIVIPDSLKLHADTIVSDTVRSLKKISSDAIDKQVTYNAEGYIKNDLVGKKSIMVTAAIVNYGDIEIKADSIVFDMETNMVYAVGIKDSTGTVTGKPSFKSGSQEFEADTLRYNFKTKKAVVKNIITQQDEGLLHSAVTKLLDDGTSNIYNSTYSTCDADTPHFAIYLLKAKVYPGKKIVSGPANLVLEGIPLPLYLPFGFFPVQTKTAASGLIIPRPHYEEGRGYALTDGGYYFAINDYFDLTLKGNFFANGSWMTTASTSYNKLYKYSGNFSFSYANNISGHKGLSDYNKSTNYSLGWTYSQNAKARPGSRFSASVNMSSSGFDRNNSYNLNDHITTTRQSSVSYSKTWEGTPFNFSASMNHSQNVRNKTVSLNLPRMSFSASRIYPLKRKNSTGSQKWYQELQFQYSASLDNQISTYDSLLFTGEVWKNMRNGFSHDAPLSLQIRPFRNFSISPQISYRGVMYTQKIERRWDPAYIDPVTNAIVPSVVRDTLRGFFYGHAINPSISAGYSPQIFGMFQFTNPDSRLQVIRHVMKPSVSFSYVPSFQGFSSRMYRQVQVNVDTTRTKSEYSIFEGNIYGTPSLSRRSGNLSFSLTNILEAKIFQRNDTTGKPQKVNLIDNFGINTSYNIFADSLRWSPITMVMRTTLFKNINISTNSNFSLYGLNSRGSQIGTYYYSQTKKLMRLNSFTVGMDFSLSELLKGKDAKKKSGTPQASSRMGETISRAPNPESPVSGTENRGSQFDEYGYATFDVPWSMNINYSMNYSKPSLKSTFTQTLSVNGNVALTKKMNITYSTGYDFTSAAITMTQITVTRDLHCWDMSFNWIPNGYMKMWEFSIKVKASVLADLKYERRKDYHDNY